MNNHNHNGINSPRLQPNAIIGFYPTVSTIPTNKPSSFQDQIQIYVNGATLTLYVYDAENKIWRKTTLT